MSGKGIFKTRTECNRRRAVCSSRLTDNSILLPLLLRGCRRKNDQLFSCFSMETLQRTKNRSNSHCLNLGGKNRVMAEAGSRAGVKLTQGTPDPTPSPHCGSEVTSTELCTCRTRAWYSTALEWHITTPGWEMEQAGACARPSSTPRMRPVGYFRGTGSIGGQMIQLHGLDSAQRPNI